MSDPIVDSRRWNGLQKALFRFFASYFLLYSTAFLFDELWSVITLFFAHILHINVPKKGFNGSGDAVFDYVQTLTTAILAFISMAIWTVVDRKSQHYDRLMYWLYVFVRYELGFFLISYGFAKIFKTQFPYPSPARLTETYGNSSPMALAWTFMGYSYGFNLFTGIAEALGGLLLFFRRTTVFGSLFSMTVLCNIVAMNFCYDIPVKLFSIHLLLMALFITLPHAQRLVWFFFYNRAVAATTYFPVIRKKGWRITRIVLKTVILLLLAGQQISEVAGMIKDGNAADKNPLIGVYTLEKMTRSNADVPLLVTDTATWHQLIINNEERQASEKITNIP